jgi:hypothetical protein
VTYGIKHFNLDTVDDLTNLRKDNLTPGSTIFIINTSKYYMLNGKREWVEINPFHAASSNNGSGGDGSSAPGSGIYDGGSIDNSDPI